MDDGDVQVTKGKKESRRKKLFMMQNWRMRAVMAGVMGGAVLWAAGCSGDHVAARDFNELIPRMMGAIKDRGPVDAATNLFNVTNADERRDAIAYLQTKPYGHEASYMKAYELLTTDPSPMVRAQAMRALGSSGQAEAVPYLVNGNGGKTGLNDPEAEVRRDAAVGLTTTFDATAIPALADHVRGDVDDQVRINCARALGNAATPSSIRALIDALDDRNVAVVFYAHESLTKVTGQALPADSKPWLGWYQQTYERSTTHSAGQG